MVEGFARGRRVQAIPFDEPPSRHPRLIWATAKAGIDFVAHNLPRAHHVLVRINPYPKPWVRVDVPCADGAFLAAWYGPGRPGAPAVLMLPGTFQTKDDTPRKRRAIRLHREHGAHVLIVDLRGFGGSHRLLGTGGQVESRDAHDAADWLKARSGADRVTLWGESLGGAAALLAGTMPEAESRFSQVLAWSPFADLELASKVANADARTLIARMYRGLLRYRTRNKVHDFEEYLALCATQQGVASADFMRAGSPVHHAAGLRVPAFVFHAEDDPVVPVDHARMLSACETPRLHVHVVPRGGHLDFDLLAPEWYAQVTRAFLAPQPP